MIALVTPESTKGGQQLLSFTSSPKKRKNKKLQLIPLFLKKLKCCRPAINYQATRSSPPLPNLEDIVDDSDRVGGYLGELPAMNHLHFGG